MMMECALFGAGNVILGMICIQTSKENEIKKTLGWKKEERILEEFLKVDTYVLITQRWQTGRNVLYKHVNWEIHVKLWLQISKFPFPSQVSIKQSRHKYEDSCLLGWDTVFFWAWR